ncbi:hypothetical protein BZG36_02982 [Bifiguratus adelaidae]|uniref:PH domain-containing protein n=1 Tax=Bifiguratus adelaidae TaxID=1938954 RepID=A0A261XYB7_9FUNG|nr:hypothetical protein BZG36_02982 [Bifiguratus adelaidae]
MEQQVMTGQLDTNCALDMEFSTLSNAVKGLALSADSGKSVLHEPLDKTRRVPQPKLVRFSSGAMVQSSSGNSTTSSTSQSDASSLGLRCDGLNTDNRRASQPALMSGTTPGKDIVPHSRERNISLSPSSSAGTHPPRDLSEDEISVISSPTTAKDEPPSYHDIIAVPTPENASLRPELDEVAQTPAASRGQKRHRSVSIFLPEALRHTLSSANAPTLSPASRSSTVHHRYSMPALDRGNNTDPSNSTFSLPLSLIKPEDDLYAHDDAIHHIKLSNTTASHPEDGSEVLPEYSCSVYKMGWVRLKYEVDGRPGKERDRRWRRRYVVLWGTALSIYRVPPPVLPSLTPHTRSIRSASALSLPHIPFTTAALARSRSQPFESTTQEAPLQTLSMQSAQAGLPPDYTKRPHTLRLRCPISGTQILMRPSPCTHIGMISWIEHLQASANVSAVLDERGMPWFITLRRRRRYYSVGLHAEEGQLADAERRAAMHRDWIV